MKVLKELCKNMNEDVAIKREKYGNIKFKKDANTMKNDKIKKKMSDVF